MSKTGVLVAPQKGLMSSKNKTKQNKTYNFVKRLLSDGDFSYHICNFIFLPSSSIVLILKSIPKKKDISNVNAPSTTDVHWIPSSVTTSSHLQGDRTYNFHHFQKC